MKINYNEIIKFNGTSFSCLDIGAVFTTCDSISVHTAVYIKVDNDMAFDLKNNSLVRAVLKR